MPVTLETPRAALRYAFEELRRERVISLIQAANARSIRVAEALGETLAGDTQLLGSTSLVYEVRADIRAR